MERREWRPRVVGLVLSAAAVALLAVAVLTRSWWTHRVDHDTSIDVGPWSAEVCVGAHSRGYLRPDRAPAGPEERTACTTQRLSEVARRLDANYDRFIIGDVWGVPDRPPKNLFGLIGVIVLALGATAELLLLVLSIAVASGSRRRGWRSVAVAAAIASGGLLAFALAFVVVAPPSIDQMSIGLGFTCALAGACFGLAGGSLLAGEEAGAPAPIERTPELGRAVVVLTLGALVTIVSLHSRTWWIDENPNLRARHGVRDGETCEQGEPACEIETWNSQPVGATGPRPVKRLVAFRASEAAFQLGHLAVMVAVLLAFLLLRGQRVTGRFAPQRVLAALAVAYLIAATVLSLGAVPDSIDEHAKRSFGPLLALLGGALLLAGAAMTRRLGARPGLPSARARRQ